MKKVLSAALVLCMTVVLLASCGGSMASGKKDALDFQERLAEAISDGDNDEFKNIVEEIKEYGKEQYKERENNNELYEDYQDDMEKIRDDIEDIREDDKIASSALNTLEDAIEYAESYVACGVESDVKDVYDEIIETVKEAVSAANSKDSEAVREIAIDFRDKYYEKCMDARKGDIEYDDKFGELEDTYGENLMEAVESVYRSAYLSNDDEYMEYQDEDSMACNQKIKDLKKRYDF